MAEAMRNAPDPGRVFPNAWWLSDGGALPGSHFSRPMAEVHAEACRYFGKTEPDTNRGLHWNMEHLVEIRDRMQEFIVAKRATLEDIEEEMKTHLEFKEAIKILTGKEKLGLEAFALSREQWKIAEDLASVLELFNNLTLRFSQANVPLVYEVIPMLECLEHSMTLVRDASNELSVIRIAAEAALIMIGKYYALTDDNEVYRIAIAMCPDKKFEWFEKNLDWHHED
ncbi:hypothetical protein BU15DRAFT_79069 [Melanogaster broomeanus]|nr:hypothetical protein BU15DRAFT_79069 [Melanogaster broomeanus]